MFSIIVHSSLSRYLTSLWAGLCSALFLLCLAHGQPVALKSRRTIFFLQLPQIKTDPDTFPSFCFFLLLLQFLSLPSVPQGSPSWILALCGRASSAAPQPARVQNECWVSSFSLPSNALCAAVVGREVVPTWECDRFFTCICSDLGLASLLALGSPPLIQRCVLKYFI